MSRFAVRSEALRVPADDADRLAADLAAAASTVARVACPDTGSPAVTGQLAAVLQVLGGQMQGLSLAASDDARALREVCASYAELERRVVAGVR